MITEEQINRGGSKLEITRALIETGLDREIPIPRSTWKYYGQGLDSVLDEFQRMKKPVIVRGSHQNDYHGFIDVVTTMRDVETISQLEDAVKKIEHEMTKESVKVHCEDWNQPYTPEVHVLIQEQGSNIVGTMIRHPNSRNELRIQYIDINDTGSGRNPVSHATIGDLIKFHHVSELRIPDSEIHRLVAMYERLENSGVLDQDWSQQVEFGFDPLMFYQARPFKRFQEKGKFNIYDLPFDIPWEKKIISHTCFGITPPEGIDLEFHFLDGYSFGPFNPPELPLDGPYGLGLTSKPRQGVPLNCRLRNLSVFCSPCEDFNYLFHNNYRFMKKADFTLISALSLKRIGKEYKQSRAFFDGENGVIIPIQYLK